MSNSKLQNIVVIAYGSELRGDDGAGRAAAALIDAAHLPNVRTISVHQLAPELSEEIARAEQLFFLDAYSADRHAVTHVERIGPRNCGGALGHVLDPASLLQTAEALFGCSPTAWIVRIPGCEFDFHEGFSETTRLGIASAVAHVMERAGTPVLPPHAE